MKWKINRSNKKKLPNSYGPEAMGHNLELNDARKIAEQLWHDQYTQEHMKAESIHLCAYVYKKRNGRYCFVVTNEQLRDLYAKQFKVTLEWVYDGKLWSAAR